MFSLTLAEDDQPHCHVDKDPGETQELDQVVHEQVNRFLADKPWQGEKTREGSVGT